MKNKDSIVKGLAALVLGACVASDSFGLDSALTTYKQAVAATAGASGLPIYKRLLSPAGAGGQLVAALESHLSSAAVALWDVAAWAGDLDNDGHMFGVSVCTLVLAYESRIYGGVHAINAGGIAGIEFYTSVSTFYKFFKADGVYESAVDHSADGILSLYDRFCGAFGNNHEEAEANYMVAAKGGGQSDTDRRKETMIAAMAIDKTLNCNGGVGATRRINTLLQLMLLTEVAEKGTAGGKNLDTAADALTYTSAVFDKLIFLLKEIKKG
jgi:hypothetical protein